MIVKLDTQRLQTLDQVREFLAGSRPLDLQPETRAEAYAFVAETLQTGVGGLRRDRRVGEGCWQRGWPRN